MAEISCQFIQPATPVLATLRDNPNVGMVKLLDPPDNDLLPGKVQVGRASAWIYLRILGHQLAHGWQRAVWLLDALSDHAHSGGHTDGLHRW